MSSFSGTLFILNTRPTTSQPHLTLSSSSIDGIIFHFLSRNTYLTFRSLDFIDEHPGGAKILKRVAGKDATKQFWKYHNESVLKKYSERLKIGTVKDKAKL